MITLSALYRLAEEENIAVDCYKLKREKLCLSWMMMVFAT